jgi:hypothetical protein
VTTSSCWLYFPCNSAFSMRYDSSSCSTFCEMVDGVLDAMKVCIFLSCCSYYNIFP